MSSMVQTLLFLFGSPLCGCRFQELGTPTCLTSAATPCPCGHVCCCPYFAELGQAGWSTGGLFALAAFPTKWHTLTASEMQFNINVDIWTETNGPYLDAEGLLLSRGTDNIPLVLFMATVLITEKH